MGTRCINRLNPISTKFGLIADLGLGAAEVLLPSLGSDSNVVSIATID